MIQFVFMQIGLLVTVSNLLTFIALCRLHEIALPALLEYASAPVG